MGNRLAQRVLLIGWDGADWKVINHLMEAGKMPNLEKFVNEGVMGNLATLYPELSPMLWTSIATGKRPFKHGILGFTEPNPHGSGIRPITSLSRKTKALWNILSQKGMKSIVVGWWPSHPAEPINGVMVSNHYQRAVAPHGKPWPMQPETVYPPRLVRNLAELRLHPQDLDVGLIMNFVPKLAEIDQDKDHRIEGLAKIIADCTTISRAATALLHYEPWDFAAIYFDSVDHFCHGYMNYHPPRLPWVEEKDFDLYQLVVEGGYIYHDIILGELLKETDANTAVILMSDHGFHSDHLRPRSIPLEPAGPAIQHRFYGVFAAKGPGIRKDERIYGANLLDICPTTLLMFGLPIGEDMDGKPLVNLFTEPPVIETIPSWDDVPGADGSHPPDKQVDPVEAQEAIRQLVELGYIEAPGENAEQAAAETVRELRYDLARSYIDANRHADAIPILEELLVKWPDEYRFTILLINCLHALDRVKETRPLLEELVVRREKNAKTAREKLKEFMEQHKDQKFEDLKDEEKHQYRRLRNEAGVNPAAMDYLMGSLLFAEGDEEGALQQLKKSEKADPRNPALLLKLGDVYLKMKQWENAEKNFRKLLANDPDSASAHLGVCRSLLPRRRIMEAASAALDAVGLVYHNPYGHYLLGIALHRMGRLPRAIEALEVAISQNPNFPEAHRRLAYIYEKRLRDPIRAEEHRRLAAEAAERIQGIQAGTLVISPAEIAPIATTSGAETTAATPPDAPAKPEDLAATMVVVSGLPRSGTSMMMQMLQAGGLPVLTDGKRAADADNPRGYFEFEQAGKLQSDREWLPGAKGKAVKIVAQLLRFLPPLQNLSYRVIFMERSLAEVIASQNRMLARDNKTGANLAAPVLARVFTRQINQIRQILTTARIPTLFVDYNQTIAEPAATAARVNAFLGGILAETDMTAAVEASLYRERK